MARCSLDSYRVPDGGRAVPDNRVMQYRRLAAECLRLAPTVGTEQARRALLEMARVWTRLANEQDAAVWSERTGEPASVVLQQQQVQADDGDRG